MASSDSSIHGARASVTVASTNAVAPGAIVSVTSSCTVPPRKAWWKRCQRPGQVASDGPTPVTGGTHRLRVAADREQRRRADAATVTRSATAPPSA